jgi:hypothetical protein
MLTHRVHPIIWSPALRTAPAVGREQVRVQLRLIEGYVALLICGAAITYGQFMAWTHFAAPWREVLVIASALLEYTGLARLSDWMHIALCVDQNVERYRRHPLSAVRISSEAPSEAHESLV